MAEVDALFDRTLMGRGREAVRAGGNLVAHLPRSTRPAVLHETFFLKPDRETWAWMLMVAWFTDSTAT